MEALGIGGLVMQAVAGGLSGEQARQLFKGKAESVLWGPMGRPAAGASQDDPMGEWATAAVRAEFSGNLEGFLAYKRAEAKGLFTIIGNKGRG